MSILREGLVAGNVSAGFRVLVEAQRGHVVQQGGNGFLQLANFIRIRQPAAGLVFLVADNERVEQAGAQHIRDRVKRQIGKP